MYFSKNSKEKQKMPKPNVKTLLGLSMLGNK